GQFCPVAMTAELLTRRWTPLVVRELLCGSGRFNEIRRGVPKMSPSLLSTRLTELEEAGVLERRRAPHGDHDEYHLTPAGEELRPIIMQMGVWGRRWARAELAPGQLDAGLLMWDIRRRIRTERVPGGCVVIHFELEEASEKTRDFWLVVDGDDVDLCLEDPGRPVELDVRSDVRTLTNVWMGDLPIAEALRQRRIELRGPAALRRAFPGWLALSLLAGVERAGP
ncbi:MAG: winged helix-turn-helix transcriptional regulator, partial [Gemmatimonadota bacterium]